MFQSFWVRSFAILVFWVSSTAAFAQVSCNASTLPQVADCLRLAQTSTSLTMNIRSNISCSGTACCPHAGGYLNISNIRNLTIEGNGFTFSRFNPSFPGRVAPGCAALRVVDGSSNVRVRNWTIDENANPTCLDASCDHSVVLHHASNLTFTNFNILNAIGTAVWAWSVNGLTYENSQIRNAGILGLHIGNKTWADTAGRRYPSSNIRVLNNRFIGIRNNALGLDGIEGTGNLVRGNYFENNHWQGLWKLEGLENNKYSGGGQSWIGIARNLEFTENTITSGYCRNCHTNLVVGLEMGYWEDIGQRHLENVRVHRNTIMSNTAGIYFDATRQSVIDGVPRAAPGLNVVVTDNTVLMNQAQIVTHATNASITNNRLIAPAAAHDFESNVAFNTWRTSATGSTSANYCTTDFAALFGNCVHRLMTATVGTQAGAGLYKQGLNVSIPTGRTRAFLNFYYRKGQYPGGLVCIVFQNSSGGQLSQSCQNLPNQVRWEFDGLSMLNVTIPTGARRAAVKFGIAHSNSIVDVDRVQLGFQ